MLNKFLNSKLSIKQEIESVIIESSDTLSELSRPKFNKILEIKFIEKDWESQPSVFDGTVNASARMDFLKDRIWIEVGFTHASYIGIDLLKFQVSSYSSLDKIDVGVFVVTTREFQKTIKKEFGLNWEGSLTFEKIVNYLPLFKSAIQVPIFVIGIDL